MNMDVNNQQSQPLLISQKKYLANGRDKFPLLGYSTSKGADQTALRRCLRRAIDMGVRLLDTSYSDRCEAMVGQVLRKCWKAGYDRGDFFIISKLPAIGNHKADVSRFLSKSLKNLGLDQVDIYLIESPVGLLGTYDDDLRPRDTKGNLVVDLATDLVKVWSAMEDEYIKGRARFIGVCNFNIEQIDRICRRSRVRPSFAMMDINAYNQRRLERKWLFENSIEPLAIIPFCDFQYGHPPGRPRLVSHRTVLSMTQKHSAPARAVLLKYLVQENLITFLQSTIWFSVNNILKSYDSLNLTQSDLFDLDGLEHFGAARMRDFVEYHGTQNHPEFPFSYDINVDDEARGRQTASQRIPRLSRVHDCDPQLSSDEDDSSTSDEDFQACIQTHSAGGNENSIAASSSSTETASAVRDTNKRRTVEEQQNNTAKNDREDGDASRPRYWQPAKDDTSKGSHPLNLHHRLTAVLQTVYKGRYRWGLPQRRDDPHGRGFRSRDVLRRVFKRRKARMLDKALRRGSTSRV